MIFDNKTDNAVCLLVHCLAHSDAEWKTHGWYRLEPWSKAMTTTACRTTAYYYAEALVPGGIGLDRVPSSTRHGWWGRHRNSSLTLQKPRT